MLSKIITGSLNEKQKLALKSRVNGIKGFFIKYLLSYDAEDLTRKLRDMGIKETDTLLVHSNTNPESGFKGAPLDLVSALVDFVGKDGNLLMVSIPFRGSVYDYLSKGKPFHKDKTLSMMGLITEIFRRKAGVKRSLSPTHPVLAAGKDSDWIVEGHERCKYPCGAGSPFEKFRNLNGKILLYDVGFGAITFFHHVEEITKDLLPFSVYHEQPFYTKAYDEKRNEYSVTTYAFNKDIRGDARRLEPEMNKKRLVKYGRIGNTSLILIEAADVVRCQTEMIRTGNLPYIPRGPQEAPWTRGKR